MNTQPTETPSELLERLKRARLEYEQRLQSIEAQRKLEQRGDTIATDAVQIGLTCGRFVRAFIRERVLRHPVRR
jgi:AraC-like DNA-binding protein